MKAALILALFFGVYPFEAESARPRVTRPRVMVGSKNKPNAPIRQNRLIKWIQPGWVDVNGLASGKGTAFESDEPNNSKEGNSSGGKQGAGNSNDSAFRNPKFGYDNDAKKSLEGGKAPPIDDKKGGGKEDPPPPEEQSEQGVDLQIFPLWYPVCVFLDPMISQEQGNAIVKGMVDTAAKCGVMIVTFPLTIKSNYPNSHTTINAQAQKSCNAIEGLRVPRASVTTLVKYDNTASDMCGLRPPAAPAAGCAQMGGGGSDQNMVNNMISGGHGSGGFASAGQAAPSIEVPAGHDATTVGHEALGHSMLGWPNGPDAGLGIGKPGAGSGGGAGSSWTGLGCGQMRATALNNDRRYPYDRNRKYYYARSDSPDRQFDLMEGRKLFRGPPPPPREPPPGQPPGGGSDIGMNPNETQKIKDGKLTKKKQGDGKPGGYQEDQIGQRHKRKPGSLLAQAEEKSNNGEGKQAPDKPTKLMNLPPSVGKPMGGATFGYDDNADKASIGNAEVGTDPSDVPAAINPNGLSGGSIISKAGGGSGFGYDDNAEKSLSGGSASSVNSGSGEKAPPSSDSLLGEDVNSADSGSSILGDVDSGSIDLDDEFFKAIGKRAVQEKKSQRRPSGAKRLRAKGADRGISSVSSLAEIYE